MAESKKVSELSEKELLERIAISNKQIASNTGFIKNFLLFVISVSIAIAIVMMIFAS
ncbi:hypothetical protein SAMN05661096_01041 [Marivirga sericea]|uniref:Uncharacterized protein n=1 Tax=Marivirga sericea TaxID=1028 RepID=A0A1X7ITT5_9BACT|nr:hypothetical protein [Marivirga sericea]SMG18219.1 hypothetical protein SAMN05661096_01041 [Marivirga sericea]